MSPSSSRPRHAKKPRSARAPAAEKRSPIGVFDSGIGGLTVASALRELLPAETIYYLGDTARVPYGGKSQATIERYSLELSGLLRAEQAKMIVVACNTASSLALPRLEEALDVPVIGVIAPGAKAAVEATKNGHVGVIGTQATIRSGAYERAIHALNPDIRVSSHACPMLVPVIESGWLDDPITDMIIRRYLEKLAASSIDTLVLGCTHYPLLHRSLQKFLGPDIHLVDSARNCALAVEKLLKENSMIARGSHPGKLNIALTDLPDGFLHIAREALGLQPDQVQLRTV